MLDTLLAEHQVDAGIPDGQGLGEVGAATVEAVGLEESLRLSSKMEQCASSLKRGRRWRQCLATLT